MVWKEAAEEEMKNRVVPLGQSEQAKDMVFLPTPALSSPLLKACKDSRAALLLLAPTALKVVGCDMSTSWHRFCCDFARPSGTLYINSAVDTAIVIYVVRRFLPVGLDEILPGFCGNHCAIPQKDVHRDFERSITTIWGFLEDRRGSTSVPYDLTADDAVLYQLHSKGYKQSTNYDRFLCDEVEPETAEEQHIEETMGSEDYTRTVSSVLRSVRLGDFHDNLATMSGPRLLQHYSPLFTRESWWERLEDDEEDGAMDDEDDGESNDEEDDEMDDKDDEKEDNNDDE